MGSEVNVTKSQLGLWDWRAEGLWKTGGEITKKLLALGTIEWFPRETDRDSGAEEAWQRALRLY